jgi:NAD(P)-dependent dehydrogenase (short-subunit alcohol dehydrogenase family)
MSDTAVSTVTGASRGLGAAIALWLAKVGAADIAKPDECHKTILLF